METTNRSMKQQNIYEEKNSFNNYQLNKENRVIQNTRPISFIATETSESIEDILVVVQGNFKLKPTKNAIIDIMLSSGKFDITELESYLMNSFGTKVKAKENQIENDKKRRKGIAITLSEAAITNCRKYQNYLIDRLDMDLDIDAVINAMLVGGDFDPIMVEKALRTKIDNKKKEREGKLKAVVA